MGPSTRKALTEKLETIMTQVGKVHENLEVMEKLNYNTTLASRKMREHRRARTTSQRKRRRKKNTKATSPSVKKRTVTRGEDVITALFESGDVSGANIKKTEGSSKQQVINLMPTEIQINTKKQKNSSKKRRSEISSSSDSDTGSSQSSNSGSESDSKSVKKKEKKSKKESVRDPRSKAINIQANTFNASKDSKRAKGGKKSRHPGLTLNLSKSKELLATNNEKRRLGDTFVSGSKFSKMSRSRVGAARSRSRRRGDVLKMTPRTDKSIHPNREINPRNRRRQRRATLFLPKHRLNRLREIHFETRTDRLNRIKADATARGGSVRATHGSSYESSNCTTSSDDSESTTKKEKIDSNSGIKEENLLKTAVPENQGKASEESFGKKFRITNGFKPPKYVSTTFRKAEGSNAVAVHSIYLCKKPKKAKKRKKRREKDNEEEEKLEEGSGARISKVPLPAAQKRRFRHRMSLISHRNVLDLKRLLAGNLDSDVIKRIKEIQKNQK